MSEGMASTAAPRLLPAADALAAATADELKPIASTATGGWLKAR
jgi:hypothetical protein